MFVIGQKKYGTDTKGFFSCLSYSVILKSDGENFGSISNNQYNPIQSSFYLLDVWWSVAYQQKNNYPVLKDYDKNVLIEDIQLSRQYKILIDDQIACIFSVYYSDELFWREKEKNEAVYLHRIGVNPNYKGQK